MMNLNDIVRRIKAISFALDKVEVRGRDNHDIILGSIQELERVAATLEKSLREMEPEGKTDILEAEPVNDP